MSHPPEEKKCCGDLGFGEQIYGHDCQKECASQSTLPPQVANIDASKTYTGTSISVSSTLSEETTLRDKECVDILKNGCEVHYVPSLSEEKECTCNLHEMSCQAAGKLSDKPYTIVVDTPTLSEDWREEFETILEGIDKDEIENKNGWWESSTGAEFGSRKKKELEDFIAKIEKAAYERGKSDFKSAKKVHAENDQIDEKPL